MITPDDLFFYEVLIDQKGINTADHRISKRIMDLIPHFRHSSCPHGRPINLEKALYTTAKHE